MNVVWKKGKATVRDVYEALRETRPLAYTTVMTVLGTLTKKGILEREMRGRAYIYHPKVSREEALRRNVRYLAGKFFGGSACSLVAHLIEWEGLSPRDLEELRRMIERRLREEGL